MKQNCEIVKSHYVLLTSNQQMSAHNPKYNKHQPSTKKSLKQKVKPDVL